MIKKKYTVLLSVLLLLLVIASGCSNKAREAKTGDTVKVHYTGKLLDGTVFDTSVGSEPLEFTVGQGQLLAGFEQAVTGMKPGELKTITIPADEAYGPYRDDFVFEIGKDKLQEGLVPEIGMQLQMTQTDGNLIIVKIIAISETTITIDANHDLAGQDLVFDIELVEIAASGSRTTSSPSIPLEQALANGKPTIAEFGSDSCVPCKQMKPILENLSVEYKNKVNVVVIEVYEQRELTQQYKIMAIPTQVFFAANGKEVFRHTGFFAKEDILYELKSMGIE